MSIRKEPRRVRIRNVWYDVRSGWAGKLELYEYMKAPAYTADTPFAHITNLFHVYDSGGSKVGEFHTDNGRISFQGVVEDIEL